MQGPLSDDSMQQVDESSTSSRSGFLVWHPDFWSFLDGLGRWVLGALDAMGECSLDALVRSSVYVFVRLGNVISHIFVESDYRNDSRDILEPFFPHQLFSSDMRTLLAKLQQDEYFLKRCYSHV